MAYHHTGQDKRKLTCIFVETLRVASVIVYIVPATNDSHLVSWGMYMYAQWEKIKDQNTSILCIYVKGYQVLTKVSGRTFNDLPLLIQ